MVPGQKNAQKNRTKKLLYVLPATYLHFYVLLSLLLTFCALVCALLLVFALLCAVFIHLSLYLRFYVRLFIALLSCLRNLKSPTGYISPIEDFIFLIGVDILDI